MNICILGERSKQLDEGMKNISIQLHNRFKSRGLNSILLDLRDIGTLQFWKELRRIDPDIVHLVPGPTGKGLVLLRILAEAKRCKTVATVTQPRFNRISRFFARFLRPSLVYLQSESARSQFEEFGYTTELLPSGVDLEKFTPCTKSRQEELRDELGLPRGERIFLHVGHFKRGRSVESLLELQSYGHVVIVGSPSTGPEADLVELLRNAGATVKTEYVPDIEKYYQSADIYVFPVLNEGNSIQAPLSVLEAMACNIPVVATRFGGLTDLFEEGGGLRYISSFGTVDKSDLQFDSVRTRDKVSKYSWETIIDQVIESYRQLCNEER